MKVKQKLICYAVIVSIALTILTIIFLLLSNAVQSRLNKAADLSQKAVSSSDGVQQTITTSQNELNTMADKLGKITEPLNSNKQRLAILDRKSDSIISRIDDLNDMLLMATESLEQDSEAIYEIEDALYELEDIQIEIKRELQANIQTMAGSNNAIADEVIRGAAELAMLNTKFQSAFESLVAVNQSNTTNNQNAITTIKNATDKNKQASIILTSTITIIAFLVVAVVTYTIVLVTKPLDKLAHGIDKVANGDFTTKFTTIHQDEFGDVAAAMNRMVTKIKDTIEQINQEANTLLSTADTMEINSVATKTAIEKNQDEVTSVVCATQQMQQAVSSVSEASNESLSASRATSEASTAGVTIVQENNHKVNNLAHQFNQATSVVSNVQAHTEEIAAILDVIKNITEQTNLLALNAAIEAARAGEQGRGFAVVADEVRQLALRTQSSTSQITSIIQGLIESSENAVNYMKESEKGVSETTVEANKINEVFNTITEKVNDIYARTELVATASEEQSQVSKEVKIRMENIELESRNVYSMADDVVNQSASLKLVSRRIAKQLAQFQV